MWSEFNLVSTADAVASSKNVFINMPQSTTQTNPDLPIVYEDHDLLVICKPANVLSQGDRTGDPDVVSLVRRYLQASNGSNPFVGLVHRLDRPVYGLLMIAKTSAAARALDEQQKKQLIRKEYRAIVHGEAPVNGVWRHFLLKDRKTNIVEVVKENNPNGQEAVLSFQRLSKAQNFSLLAIYLQTGRPHQIRVQCTKEGYPIYGDYKYGRARAGDDKQMALYASRLSFQHPSSDKPLNLEAPPPTGYPWNIFE